MKILIISDSHGYDSNFFDILSKTGQPDMLIHLGDAYGNEDIYKRSVSCEVKVVSGNNDLFLGSSLNPEEEFDIGSHHFFLTHGHRYGVSYGTQKLLDAALSRGADIVLYGHTHVPSIEFDEDYHIWAVNPGSISMPRQSNGKPSYAVLEIDENDEIRFTLKYLER